MRYIKSRKIEGVEGFCPNTGDYAYRKKGKGYLYIDSMLLEKEDVPLELSLRGKYMYVWYGSGKFELYEGPALLNSIESGVILLNECTQYIGRTSVEFSPYWKGYNFASPIDGRPILPEFITYRLHIEDDMIIAYDNLSGELKRINNEAETLWEFSLSSQYNSVCVLGEVDRIDKILGVAHSKIWFYTDLWRLIALDLEKGEQVYSLDCFGVNWDRRTGNIFAIASNVMEIIDTEKLAIVEQYNYLESDPDGIGTYRHVFNPLLQGDYFTFLGEKEGEYSEVRWAGIFDYKARRLVWECEVISEEEYLATGNHLLVPQPLYMSGGKLYIKDSQDTLHIFERVDG